MRAMREERQAFESSTSNSRSPQRDPELQGRIYERSRSVLSPQLLLRATAERWYGTE